MRPQVWTFCKPTPPQHHCIRKQTHTATIWPVLSELRDSDGNAANVILLGKQAHLCNNINQKKWCAIAVFEYHSQLFSFYYVAYNQCHVLWTLLYHGRMIKKILFICAVFLWWDFFLMLFNNLCWFIDALSNCYIHQKEFLNYIKSAIHIDPCKIKSDDDISFVKLKGNIYNKIIINIKYISIFLLFPHQDTRAVYICLEVSASQGKAPAVTVPRSAVLGKSGWPSRHWKTHWRNWEKSQSLAHLH